MNIRPRGAIKNIIMEKIEKSSPHSIFFISDFVNIGSPETVRKIFFQATKYGTLERVGQGIYVKPKESRFGKIPVPLELIAQEIAERDKCQILPTGSTAANLIGLSTQVPMNLSYITTGSTRAIEIGNRNIYFRHAAPKNFAPKGKVVPILIQGMREVGEENITEQQFSAIKNFIEKVTDPFLHEDLALAPLWIQKIIKRLIQN